MSATSETTDKAPRPIFAHLRCGLVIGPLVELSLDAEKRKVWVVHHRVGRVRLAKFDARWNYAGEIEATSEASPARPNPLDIVDMFELGDDFEMKHGQFQSKQPGAYA